jgi:hypothetical protein
MLLEEVLMLELGSVSTTNTQMNGRLEILNFWAGYYSSRTKVVSNSWVRISNFL